MSQKFYPIFLFGILLNMFHVSAQTLYDPETKFGLTLGATTGKISNLDLTIISEPYFIGYRLDQTQKIGWQGGAFVQYNINTSAWFLYGEASFLQQNTNLHFLNEQTSFSYDMTFKHAYANILGMAKVHPLIRSDTKILNGIYFAAGPHVGFIVADRIHYKSQNSLPEFGEDSYQSQQLERVLKGKTDFGMTGEIGYMIPAIRLELGLRGRYSFTDAVEAMPNSYNFIENSNKSLFWQVVLKLDLSDL